MRADAVPNAASPPRHGRTMRFSQTAGRVSSKHPPRRPTASPSAKGPTERELQAAERRNGRGNNDIELPSKLISYLLLSFDRGHIFNSGLSGDN